MKDNKEDSKEDNMVGDMKDNRETTRLRNAKRR